MSAYVIIQITGKRTERALERMRQADIPIYSVVRVSPMTVELTLSARSFKRLHVLLRGSDCRIHIVRRVGRVFYLQRLYRRYALWSVGIVMLLLMGAASTRILWIEIDGCSRISEQTILRALEEQGLKIGVSRTGWDFPTLNNQIRSYDERIAWAGLSLNGVILRVNIVEAILTTDEEDPQAPADIFAQKDGIITYVEATQGRAVVSAGDAVSAGDLLIRGDLTLEDSQFPVYAHASGKVLAKVVYIGESIADKETVRFFDSGESIPYREIRIAGKLLFASSVPYDNYELRDFKETLVTDILLPVTVTEAVCYEQTEQQVALSKAEMIENALYDAEQFAFLKIPKDAAVVEKQAAYTELNGQILGIVTVFTEESIGLTKEIEIDGTNGLHDF